MPKRTSETAELHEGTVNKAAASGAEPVRARPAGQLAEVPEDQEMGPFEDQWEDDVESDGEVVDAGEDREDGEGEDGQCTDVHETDRGLPDRVHPGA